MRKYMELKVGHAACQKIKYLTNRRSFFGTIRKNTDEMCQFFEAIQADGPPFVRLIVPGELFNSCGWPLSNAMRSVMRYLVCSNGKLL